ncbi:restriction endonuclease subunit S [Georgenia muralis]|nr:restriction endonuclease subunit S [Georgenia muralis]
MTVAADRGLVDQENFFTKKVASKNLTTYYVVERGDLVYNKSSSKDAPFGVVARMTEGEPGVVTPLYICFRADTDFVTPEFLELACNSSTFFASLAGKLREGARSHGLLNVRLEEFFAAQVLLPPLDVQRRIVDLIGALDDNIEASVAELGEGRTLLDATRTAVLSEIPSSGSIAEVLTKAKAGGTPSRSRPDYYGGKVPWLKSGEVAGRSIVETEETITESAIRDSSAWMVPPGAVVIAMYGATAAQVGRTASELATNQAVLALVPDNSAIDGRFLYHWASNASARLKHAATGAAQANLSKEVVLRLLERPLVDIGEQRDVVNILDAIADVESTISRHLAASREFRANLIPALLSGAVEIPESYDELFGLQEAV